MNLGTQFVLCGFLGGVAVMTWWIWWAVDDIARATKRIADALEKK